MGWAWQAQSTLAVQTGLTYRFVWLAPAGTTQDQAYASLCGSSDPAACTKWDITSISAPPQSVIAALQSITTAFPAATPPVAWWVIATWRGTVGALPQPDGTGYYEQLNVYVQTPGDVPVEAPDFDDAPTTPPSPSSQGDSPFASLVIGAALAAGVYFFVKAKGAPPIQRSPRRSRAYEANPVVQRLTVNVNGRATVFAIDTDGPTWTATADIRAGRRKRIVGSGSSKSEALQQAVQLASRAYASADVRA